MQDRLECHPSGKVIAPWLRVAQRGLENTACYQML